MRVLQFTDSLRSGGKERQLVELLKWLSEVPELENELIVMSDDNHYADLDELHIPTHRIIRRSKRDPYVFLKLYRLLLRRQPDILHSWNSMCSVYAMPVLKMPGIKFVNNFLRDAPTDFGVKNKDWIRAKLTFTFSDVIAANSYAGLKAYSVPERKAACIHNGFDFNRLKGLASKAMTRDQFNVCTKHVVGMVASFSERKDHTTFITAANKLLEKRKDVTFIAIGDGIQFKSAKKIINPKYRDKFKMVGRQKRVLNIVNLFDIGILTTNTRVHCEGIPNAVMEYMALKKPVIVTDCGGTRELVKNNHTGFLVEPLNSDLLCQKIEFLLENNDLAMDFGRNGYEKLKKEFSLEIMGKKFFDLYARLSN